MSTTPNANERTEAERDGLLVQAYDIGAEHGRNAASWYFDGNTERSTYARVLKMLDDGDPEVYDTFPMPGLSGEWADSYTWVHLASDLEIDEDDPDMDEICAVYEDGFGVAVADDIERAAREALRDERTEAREAARYFVGKYRDDGTSFTSLSDDHPEWVKQLVCDAHDGMLPDDWRYECIFHALCFVRDVEDWYDRADEFANDMVSVNSAELIDWLGSHGSRAGWVQEAREEWGDAGSDIWDEVARGQLMEARDVFALVTRELSARL